LIEAATGAGKSHIIAAVADTIHNISGGKHILCLAPSRELVIQNREKFSLTGNPSSVFSASVGEKSLRHPVVFGTPMTVKNKIRRFGSEFAAVIVDECHGITPTIQTIISSINECNPNLRVIGLSATPYRLGTGYIYAIDEDGNPVDRSQTHEPYFAACVYKIQAQQLIDEGILEEFSFDVMEFDRFMPALVTEAGNRKHERDVVLVLVLGILILVTWSHLIEPVKM